MQAAMEFDHPLTNTCQSDTNPHSVLLKLFHDVGINSAASIADSKDYMVRVYAQANVSGLAARMSVNIGKRFLESP